MERRPSAAKTEPRQAISSHGVACVEQKLLEDSRLYTGELDLAGRDTAGVHVSFDMDVCDPTIAPGVGTPVKGGLDYREAHMVMEMIADSGLLRALDLVEVNPILDDRNATAVLGAELASSALGQKII